MLNKSMIIGRLGRSPEMKTLGNGTLMAKFSVVTNSSYSKDGEAKADWHNVVAFAKTAETCGKYLSKGSLVYIEGSTSTVPYENKDGVKMNWTSLNATRVQFLDKKDKAEDNADNTSKAPQPSDDEIPF